MLLESHYTDDEFDWHSKIKSNRDKVLLDLSLLLYFKTMLKQIFLTLTFAALTIVFNIPINAQTNPVSKVWVADNGDGTYKNPIIHADYSDPDAIRVGDDFYLVSF